MNVQRASFLLCSPEASSLFRYILRLNATKIIPSESQIGREISMKYSPWFATYLSPRYSFRAPSAVEVSTFMEKRSSHFKCAYCKRFSERSTLCQNCCFSRYCSDECQQADVDEHVIVCDFLGNLYKKSEPRY